jgi:hypothetical protein
MNLTHSGLGPLVGFCAHRNETSKSIKGAYGLIQLLAERISFPKEFLLLEVFRKEFHEPTYSYKTVPVPLYQ